MLGYVAWQMLLASAHRLRHCTQAAEADTEAKVLPAVVTAADAVPAEAHALAHIVHKDVPHHSAGRQRAHRKQLPLSRGRLPAPSALAQLPA